MPTGDMKEHDGTIVAIVTDKKQSGWGKACSIGPVYQPHHSGLGRARICDITVMSGPRKTELRRKS